MKYNFREDYHNSSKYIYDNKNTKRGQEMVIVETNKCCDNIPGSQSGISTMKKVLDYLNIETDIESLHHEIDEDYSLQIKLNKKLLIRRGR